MRCFLPAPPPSKAAFLVSRHPPEELPHQTRCPGKPDLYLHEYRVLQLLKKNKNAREHGVSITVKENILTQLACIVFVFVPSKRGFSISSSLRELWSNHLKRVSSDYFLALCSLPNIHTFPPNPFPVDRFPMQIYFNLKHF